jgi:glycosyltransferase involved in cell wall biosynthesis
MQSHNGTPIRVNFFQRKPRAVGNYSVEFIFKDVRRQLGGLIESEEIFSSYESSGLLKRIYNCIEAAAKQGKVNHITGDINYIGLFLNKRKTIQTVLDCVHLSSSTGIKHAILKLFWVTIPVKRAKYVTAISQSTKNEILKYVNCDPDKIKVVHVAISEKFSRRDKQFYAKNPRILQLGTAPNKNIPRLIEALEGIPCILDIVGRHDEVLEEALKKHSISYEYSWALSDEQILQKYIQADIVSLVSTYEGFGMPILEAQATGRPVITSNILSMPEVAGDAACIVDPYSIQSIREGFEKIIGDTAYRENLIEKGFENVKRFNPHDIAMQYFELYKSISSQNECADLLV